MKRVLKKCGVTFCTEFSWLLTGSNDHYCEYDNKPFHKRRWILLPDMRLSASWEWHFPVKLVNISPFVIKHHPTNGFGGIAPRFLTSTLCGGEWSASRPGRFTSVDSSTNLVWDGMDPRCDMDTVYKRYCFAPAGSRSTISRPQSS
jgi:hypothetical protein